MIRRLFKQAVLRNRSANLVSLVKQGPCQYSTQSNEDDDQKVQTRQRRPESYHLSFAMAEEKMAQEFLDNMDDIMKKRKSRIEDEIEDLRCTEYIPEKLTASNWKILLTECASHRSRLKYLKHLAIKEFREINDRTKQKVRPEITGHRVLDELTYPSRNRLKEGSRYGCYKALVLGNPIVFDLDFTGSFREQTNAMDQLLHAYGQNLKHPTPFHIYFTGYKNTRFGNMVKYEKLDKNLFASFYENSFLDLFDRDRLVYLTPDGPVLKNYNADKVYIIGGFVDLHDRPRTSLGKTRELDIECGRLPLEKHVRLKTERDLTLTAMMNIMLHANLTNDWGEAIRNGLPRTKFQLLTKEEKDFRRMKRNPYTSKPPGWRD